MPVSQRAAEGPFSGTLLFLWTDKIRLTVELPDGMDPAGKIVRFGVFEADMRTGELCRNGIQVHARHAFLHPQSDARFSASG